MPHQFDAYGHRLIDTGDEELERRINRLAERLAALANQEGMTDRVRAIRTELFTCCMSFFRVVGQGIARGGDPFDEVLLDILMDQTDYEYVIGKGRERKRFNPDRGPFTWYIRFLFRRRTIDRGNQENRDTPDLQIEGPEEEQYGYPEPEDHEHVDPVDVLYAEELYIELLVLATRLKGMATDDRNAGAGMASTGRHMALTEAITYLIKNEDWDDATPHYLGRHERDTFRAMEVSFLDWFMEAVCRSFPEIWHTHIEHRYVTRTRYPLLNAMAYIDYLEARFGRRIAGARVTQYRNEFREQVSDLPGFQTIKA